MRRILITGSKGLLGSACVRNLFADSAILTPTYEDLTNRHATWSLFDRCGKEGPLDAVIHCAAKVGGVKANRDFPVDFLEQNLAINSNVIQACHNFGVRKLVNIGTSCLYPDHTPVPVKEDSLLTGPFSPDIEAYAIAKLAAYMSCKAHRKQFGRNYVTVCPANLYGAGDNYGPSAHVIPALIREAHKSKLTGQKMRVWGDGTATREFLHADDAAQAIRVVLDKWDSSELINIGTGKGTTIRELAELVAVVAGIGIQSIEWVDGEPIGIQHKTFDISKITELGWAQRIPLYKGIARVYSEYAKNPNPRQS